MTRLLDRLRLAWVVLGETGRPADATSVTTQRLDEPSGSRSLLGIDTSGVPQLLIPVEDTGPEGRAGAVEVRNLALETRGRTGWLVVVSCGAPALRPTFDHLVVAILEALARHPERHPGTVAVETLNDWRALLTSTKPGLGPAALAALLSELLVLRDLVVRDAAVALDSWVGPSQARHDFRRGDYAIEVKSTLSHTERRTTIHGVDQLEPPDPGSLHLAWHRLEVVPKGGLSVSSVVDELIDHGASALDLHGLLHDQGSPPALHEVHDAVRFELRERQCFLVDADFPRIVSSSFINARLPDQVVDVIYRVDLPGADLALNDAGWELMLDALVAA